MLSAQDCNPNDRNTGGRARLRSLAVGLLFAFFLLGASPCIADDYDATRAGHPLRIVAYVLHPIGVIIDYTLLRPTHWLVHHSVLKELFGHTD